MIRKIKQSDVTDIENVLNKIGHFTDKEKKTALELVNLAARDRHQMDYHLFVFEGEKKILGYYCIGLRPLTDAVYDLYWIVADPDSEIKGIGTILVKHAEQFVLENNGRWLLAETSSKESYLRTRKFYLRNNFSIIAGINDFYSVGDNLVVFGKYFGNNNKHKG